MTNEERLRFTIKGSDLTPTQVVNLQNNVYITTGAVLSDNAAREVHDMLQCHINKNTVNPFMHYLEAEEERMILEKFKESVKEIDTIVNRVYKLSNRVSKKELKQQLLDVLVKWD